MLGEVVVVDDGDDIDETMEKHKGTDDNGAMASAVITPSKATSQRSEWRMQGDPAVTKEVDDTDHNTTPTRSGSIQDASKNASKRTHINPQQKVRHKNGYKKNKEKVQAQSVTKSQFGLL